MNQGLRITYFGRLGSNIVTWTTRHNYIFTLNYIAFPWTTMKLCIPWHTSNNIPWTTVWALHTLEHYIGTLGVLLASHLGPMLHVGGWEGEQVSSREGQEISTSSGTISACSRGAASQLWTLQRNTLTLLMKCIWEGSIRNTFSYTIVRFASD